MEKLLKVIREELPEDALEIQECIELLNQSLSSCKQNLTDHLTYAATSKREYDKLEMLKEHLKMIDEFQDRLYTIFNTLQLEEEVEEGIVEKEISDIEDSHIPDYEELRVDSNIPHNLYENFTYKRPAGFELFGRRYDTKDWKEVLCQTCEVLAAKNIDLFKSFISDKNMNGRKIAYFGYDPQVIREPMKITGTNIYVMTNMSANAIRNIIEKMLRKYKIKIDDYKIYFKADYSARHN